MTRELQLPQLGNAFSRKARRQFIHALEQFQAQGLTSRAHDIQAFYKVPDRQQALVLNAPAWGDESVAVSAFISDPGTASLRQNPWLFAPNRSDTVILRFHSPAIAQRMGKGDAHAGWRDVHVEILGGGWVHLSGHSLPALVRAVLKSEGHKPSRSWRELIASWMTESRSREGARIGQTTALMDEEPGRAVS